MSQNTKKKKDSRSRDRNGENLVALFDGVDDLLVRGALDLAEDGVLAVEVRRGHVSDKELTPVRARPGVGHREDARFRELPPALELVIERIRHLLPLEVKRPDPLGFWPASSSSCRIPHLNHKLIHYTMYYNPGEVSLLREEDE